MNPRNGLSGYVWLVLAAYAGVLVASGVWLARKKLPGPLNERTWTAILRRPASRLAALPMRSFALSHYGATNYRIVANAGYAAKR